MNLLLHFVICGLISFIIKLFIMPEFFMKRVEKKIQNNDKLIQLLKEREKNNCIEIKNEVKEEQKEEDIEEKNEEKKVRKRNIKNKRINYVEGIRKNNLKSET